MSLQVWLPLNGDLTQQGLSKTSVTNNGAIVNDNGKIGKCYSFDGSDDFISLNNQKLYDIFKGGTQQFSIAFWVYHADATRAIIFGDYGLTGSISFNIELTTSHAVRFYWAGTPDKNFNSTSYVTASAWTHICLTYDGSKVQIYRNGILSTDVYNGTLATKNKTSGAFYLGRDNRTGTTALNGRLNDFRIYDHCLSEKEVKEIAKGLMLHYPLNNYSFYGKNLIYGTSKKVYSATANTANDRDKGILSGGSGGNGSFSITEEDVPVGIYSYNITNNTSGNRDFQQGRIPFISGQKYTGSWWAKGSGSCYFRSWNRTKGSAVFAKTYTLTNNWQFFSYTFTATAAQETDDCTWHLGVTGNSSIKIAGMKLELGDKPTIYSPAPEDLQLTGQEIYDTSGYENHASTIGALTLVPNSSIYNFGINMNNTGTNNHIESIKNISLSSDTITISCWVKATSKATNQVFFTMSNIQFGTLNSLGYVNPTSMAGFTLNNFINNEWNHIIVIKNGTTYQLYINGIAETQNGASNYYLHNVSKLWLLNRSYNNTYAANASISDLRIYTTTLSVDDILELYKTSKIVSGTTVTARDLE